ncbi:MAG: hypothetical protein ACI87N_001134 [Flavobacteriales bacterium]|jgi:hypothetical protein
MDMNPITIATIELKIADYSHIDGILALQELYLVDNLSAQEKQAGFVTTRFSVEQLPAIIDQKGLFIALDKGVIVAYIFAGDWEYYCQWPIFSHMITNFTNLQFKNFDINTTVNFQYGPICIHANYRGKGLIIPFFEFMRKEMVKRFPLGLTFINKINIPSLHAHTKKLKWSIIGEFEYNTNQYFILAYDMNESLIEQ